MLKKPGRCCVILGGSQIGAWVRDLDRKDCGFGRDTASCCRGTVRPWGRPRPRRDSPFPPAPVSGAARRWRAPESRAGRAPTLLRSLLQHLEAQPVGRNELGLHIRHPAYRPDPTVPRRRHRPADQWRWNDVETGVLFASDVMPHFA